MKELAVFMCPSLKVAKRDAEKAQTYENLEKYVKKKM